MSKPKLIRITTVPLSLEKLLEGQLGYMSRFYEVTAISSEEDRLVRYGKKEGVETFYVDLTRSITPLKDLKAVFKLYRYLKKTKPEIVHTHTPKAGIVGMMAAYCARVPHRLHTVAGLPLLEATGFKRRLLNFVEKLTYRFATVVFPNSKGLYDIILAEGFTRPEKLDIIGKGSSNGIDTQWFSKTHFSEEVLIRKRNELGIPDSDFVFVFVGRIVKDKGINELVNAFIRINTVYPDTTLLLVGPFEDDLDPVSETTKELITGHSKIITPGYQEDVRPFYALSDLLVFPSYREGFPNVVLQAGAMGLPAVVSDINGCNEIVEHQTNGLVVPVKDSGALKNAMECMISDETLYSHLKNNARSSILGRYERTAIWEALHKEYVNLLSSI
jgi:glycosyltransferase involved in cell wall biosynthesis